MEDKKQHCLLGGSSSGRWINCQPSARLTEDMEDVTSVYAEEGTNAHALCEYKLNRALENNDPYPELTMFDKEMDECSDSYVSFVLEKIREMKEETNEKVEVFIEHKVNFDTWVKDGFGTADCILVSSKRLHIIDFKYGRGVSVDATNNSQLKLYALGAISELLVFYDFDKVSLSIYQPGLNNVSTWKTSKDELLKWTSEVVKPAAELAYEGKGIFRCGSWCKFCPCKAICKERSKVALDILQKEFRSPKERKVYDDLNKNFAIEIKDKDITIANAGVLSNKLIQMASGAIYLEDKSYTEIHDKKLDALEDLIEGSRGKSLLVAYWLNPI